MLGIFQGDRPDITPAQSAGLFAAGVPIMSNLFSAFGVFHATAAQQDALTNAINWGVPLAAALIVGDAAVRASRNRADSHVQTAAVASSAAAAGSSAPPAAEAYISAPEPTPYDDPDMYGEADTVLDGYEEDIDTELAGQLDWQLPEDDEEFKAPPDGVVLTGKADSPDTP